MISNSDQFVRLLKRPRKSLKLNFRCLVQSELIRVWFYFKWFLKLFSLSFSDKNFICWFEESEKIAHRRKRLLAIFGSRVLNESVQWNEIVFVGWWMMVRVKYWTQRMITRSCDGILNKLSNSILALIFKDYTNHFESVKLKFLESSIPSSNGIFLLYKNWVMLVIIYTIISRSIYL